MTVKFFQNQPLEPFNILGLEPGVSDSEINMAYRKFSIQYHPDKKSRSRGTQILCGVISKLYQGLTDTTPRENFEKYRHPDGRQLGLQMGAALPQLLNIDAASGGILLLDIDVK